MTGRRIGLVVHEGRAAAVEAAGAVRRWGAANSVDVSDIDVWGQDLERCHRRNAGDEAEAAGHPALVVTVGGDGTFLRGARIAATDGVPVLGINVGRVGFLTEVEPADIDTALAAFFSGRVQLDERMMLTLCASRPLEIPDEMQALLRYGRGPLLPPPTPLPRTPAPDHQPGVALDVTALNDIVFEKLARDRQASLGVYLDQTLFASYSADALVVATPTGSTAYNFAAGGPILSPRLSALVFTPVAAHMVFNRSLVLAADEAVTVRVLDQSGQVAVSVDGQLRGVLDPGDWVTVQPASQPAHLVRLRTSQFYSRLRERFSLADAPAAVADSRMPDAADG
ncbi:NAD(+)/NADH kinase [Plantactinospora soyae]|uniref:NAD kinase n=1 Tax=Plantactinospora soyae TaxID=1544732 RepID=A0A927MIF0_9ACTN|nr:NAD(+)/NADH kinase [Plantactinospora soyae]MBE1491740.1 NAD+ kinase [Plantactinospora soyae]